MTKLTFALCLSLSGAALADPAELASKIDALYERRDDPAIAKELDAALTAALKEAPEDYGVLWRASRFKYWLSDGAADQRLKKQLGKEGWGLGDRATKANPKGAEGLYFAAIGMGSYSQAVGILKALGEGLEGQYNERLDKAITLNDAFDFGGPLVAKGRYYFELPWPKRDLKKSRELLEKVLARNPENLRARLYLSETLLKDDEPKKAKVEIDKVLSGDVAYDPPEGRRTKQQAKSIAQQIQGELE